MKNRSNQPEVIEQLIRLYEMVAQKQITLETANAITNKLLKTKQMKKTNWKKERDEKNNSIAKLLLSLIMLVVIIGIIKQGRLACFQMLAGIAIGLIVSGAFGLIVNRLKNKD